MMRATDATREREHKTSAEHRTPHASDIETTPAILRTLRTLVRGLQCGRTRVGGVHRLVRAALLLPPFGSLLIAAHLRARLGRPWRVEAVTADGSRMHCTLPDLVQMYIWLFGIWEPDLTAFVRSRLREGDGVVDVGANVGYFSLLASRCVGRSGRVAAIEAAPGIHDLLRANLTVNDHVANVRTVNAAASDRHGTLRVYRGPYHNLGKTTTAARPGMTARGDVSAAPLADLLDDDTIRSTRLVKIDVEGAEDAVLAGMASFLDRCRDDVEILVELTPQWWTQSDRTPTEVLAPLRSRGFHVYALENNYWPWRYLWPRDVRPPRRLREPLTWRVKRLDLVLSRVDAETLAP